MTTEKFPRFAEESDDEVARYRAVSSSAIAGLLLGILSPFALVDPLIWSIPLLGIVVNLIAYVRIRRNAPILIGRKAVLIGLWLSLVFLAAAPVEWLYYRACIRQEAEAFAASWFELLAAKQPEKAFQLTFAPNFRQPFDDRLAEYYRSSPDLNEAFERFTKEIPSEPHRLAPVLFAQGKKAEIQLIESVAQFNEEGKNIVISRYAITTDDDGVKKTREAVLHMKRFPTDTGTISWQLTSAAFVVPPKEEKPKEE